MARVTHVARAQQRYETVTVLDDEGNPKRTPVMRNGEQKVTKRGKPVFMTITAEDRTKPLPLRVCDFCHKDIEIGTPYKWIVPKSGPYGGTRKNRHEGCPTWRVWDYSNSLSAQIAQIQDGFASALVDAESPDDVQAALDDAAQQVRDIAEQKREGASNIVEGFGHDTEKSQELESVADELDSWADEIEAADIPDLPDIEEVDCPECDGTGQADLEVAEDADGNEIAPGECEYCDGTGLVEPEELSEDQMSQWRDDVESQVTIVDECPV